MDASAGCPVTLREGQVQVNGEVLDNCAYLTYHHRRIACSVQKLCDMGAERIVEIGAHPWLMTAALIDSQAFDLCATVSAEEVTKWPDDIGVTVREYGVTTVAGNHACVTNYSANIERTRFDIRETPDTILACEIIEHLIRSPHVMLLNLNQWLPVTGRLLVTTPNGAQFSNPLRRKSSTPVYRSNAYERHMYLYTLDQLIELLTLSGFKVLEAGYWDVYPRRGLSAIYRRLSHLPWQYCRDKFMQTIFVVGEKVEDVTTLARPPSIYDPRGQWEFCLSHAR